MPYQPRATLDNPYGPEVRFRTLDVLPPSAYYVSLDDQMSLGVYSNYPNNTVNLVVRVLNPQGVIQVEELSLLTSGFGGNYFAANLPSVEGYLLSACVTAGAAPVGSTYCLVLLGRGGLAPNAFTTAVLVAGYAGTSRYLSYPTMPPEAMFEGPGALKTLTTTVGAGLDWAFVCPLNTLWRVHLLAFTFVTSASVGSRVLGVSVHDASGNQVGFCPSPVTQLASLSYYYTLLPGAAAVATLPLASLSAPSHLLIVAGGQINSFTFGLAADDQYSAVNLQVEEWVG